LKTLHVDYVKFGFTSRKYK